MKTKNWIALIGTMLLTALAFFTFKPVPIPHEEDCLSFSGYVTNIYEAETNDVVFVLGGAGKKFYVNRGLERGLNLVDLRRELINKEVVVKYPKYWTPLDPTNAVRHLSKIEFEGETIFTELKN